MADTWETPHHPGPAMGTGLPTWRCPWSPSRGGSRWELCRTQRVVSRGKFPRVLRFWAGRSCEGGAGALLALSSAPLNFHVPLLGETDAQGAEGGHIYDPKRDTQRMENFSSTQGRSQGGSEPPTTGTCDSRSACPWQEGLRPCAGAQAADFRQRAETGKQALLKALGRTPLGLPQSPWHLLQAQHPGPDLGINTRSPRQVARMPLATLLNWVTVAQMVGARCSLPGFPFRAM